MVYGVLSSIGRRKLPWYHFGDDAGRIRCGNYGLCRRVIVVIRTRIYRPLGYLEIGLSAREYGFDGWHFKSTTCCGWAAGLFVDVREPVRVRGLAWERAKVGRWQSALVGLYCRGE